MTKVLMEHNLLVQVVHKNEAVVAIIGLGLVQIYSNLYKISINLLLTGS